MKHKKLVAGIACVLALVFSIGVAVSGSKATKETNMASSGSVSEENNSQSFGGYDFSDYTIPSSESSEIAEATGTYTTAPYDVSELCVVGTTPANIKNTGMHTVNEGIEFYVDDGYHSLVCNGEYLYKDQGGIFSCLSYYNGILYLLYDGKACMMDVAQGSGPTVIPELEAYAGNIQRLYVTTGCYFVYVDGTLFRISRKTGEEEDWIAISSPYYLSFDNDGWLYYIDNNSDGSSSLFKVTADDFSYYAENNLRNEYGNFTELVVDESYVYVLWQDGSTTEIGRFHSDLSVVGDERSWGITTYVNADGQDDGNYALELNVVDGHIYFTTYSAITDSFSLYQNHGEGSDFDLASHNASYPCVSKQGGSNTVYYLRYDENTGMWKW